LRLKPEGLAVVDRSGVTELLPWDEGSTDWTIRGVFAGEMRRAGILVSVNAVKTGSYQFPADPRRIWLPSNLLPPPIEELPALVNYLIATPAARDSLKDKRCCRELVTQLAQKEWRRPRPPEQPALGDRLDVFVAINRALDAVKWRRFERRPVREEPRPEGKDIARRTRHLLARTVSERVDDEELLRAAEAHLNVGEWPFDVLVR
jgi:hypothetical protein